MLIDQKKNNNIFSIFSNEVIEFYQILFGEINLKPGLYTFPIRQNYGRKMRIHLRIKLDGSGVLFVDVTDVIHLNHTGTIISKFALDGRSKKFTEALIYKNFTGIDQDSLSYQISNIYEMIDHFSSHNGGCLTCGLSETIEQAPIFSLKVEAPFKVDIALTYGCNNNCPHCYNEADRFTQQSLSFEDWKKVIDKITELGVPHLIITGGEATLHPDLPEIIKYADSHGMVVGLNSNGRYLANKEYMEKLAFSGLNHVQITLGSHLEDKHNNIMAANSFKQTVNGIKRAIASGIHVITNTTLMKTNMDDAEKIIDFIYDLGIKTFAMNGMIYSGGGFAEPNAITEKELPALLVRVKDHATNLGMKFLWYTPTEYCRLSPVELEIGAKRCNAGEYSICIEPNGDVLPCQSYYVSGGNIINDPWESIWDGDLFRSFRERGEDPELGILPDMCWECPDLVLCGGGCRIEREARDGIRVSENAGGGCSGCSGSCGTGSSLHKIKHNVIIEKTGGYIPFESQINSKSRSSGEHKIIQEKNSLPRKE